MNPISGLLIGTLLSVSMAPAKSGMDQSTANSVLTAVSESRASLAQTPAPSRNDAGERVSDSQQIDLAKFALDAQSSSGTSIETAGLKQAAEDKKPAAPKVPKRQILVFKATWCGACQLLNPAWPRLRDVRWRVGNRRTDHFRLVDSDEHPDLVSRYGITALPTMVLLENGREIRRTGRILNAVDLAEFYYGRLK
ncbi:MAG: thioredoxin family protein [Planctomycetota bacterium]|jgi:thiol-disulfide isomerase/thioredoxin